MIQIKRRPDNLQAVVNTGLCIGCGICAYSDKVGATRYSHKDGQALPVISAQSNADPMALAICPGKGYDIVADSAELYGAGTQYDLDLGRLYSCYAAHSNDEAVLARASSGGLMTQLALFLLESKRVDRVLVTHFTYGSAPRAECILAQSRSELLQSQGSKYCPVDLSKAVREIKESNFRVAVLGTPCQIAGIRNIQKQDPAFRDKVVMTIATFCGGVKSYHNVDLLTSRNGIEPRAVTFFRFRGKGQPGSMLIEGNSGERVEIPYPQYVGHTGLSKHLRCHLCVDATGELADIACGDAWLPRFQNSGRAWSVVLTRSRTAADLVEEMIARRVITTQQVSVDEIRASQRQNLASKKHRQKSRYRLYTLLGFAIPSFDGGYRDNAPALSTEIKVFVKHRFKEVLESLRMFSLLHRLLKPHRYSGTRP